MSDSGDHPSVFGIIEKKKLYKACLDLIRTRRPKRKFLRISDEQQRTASNRFQILGAWIFNTCKNNFFFFTLIFAVIDDDFFFRAR